MNPHSNQIHNVPSHSESHDIQKQENNVGNFPIEYTQNRQGARVVRGDKEHIKGLVGVSVQSVQYVHNHSEGHEGAEGRHRLQNCFVGEFRSARYVHKHADNDHTAVMDHRLDIDPDGANEYVTGIEHNRATGKESVGCKVGAKGVFYLPVFQERC